MAFKNLIKNEAGMDIKRRCRRAHAALLAYRKAYPGGPDDLSFTDDAIWTDILFDLRHLADRYKVDFDAANCLAQRRYTDVRRAVLQGDGSFYGLVAKE